MKVSPCCQVASRLNACSPRCQAVALLIVLVTSGCSKDPAPAVDTNRPEEYTAQAPVIDRARQKKYAAEPWLLAEGAAQPLIAAPGSDPMADLLRQYVHRAQTSLPILGRDRARALRKQMSVANRQPTTSDGHNRLLNLTMDLAQAELQLDNLDAAVEHCKTAYQQVRGLRERGLIGDQPVAETAYQVGIALMRRGEVKNSSIGNTPETSILPIRGGGVHKDQKDDRQAISYFTDALQRSLPESSLHLKAKYLLNIVYMTIGAYPKGVPKQYLIPPSAYESKVEFPRFVNIAPKVGVDVWDILGGVIIDDFTGDGYLDIIVSNWDPENTTRFFRNNQDGAFSDETDKANLSVGGWNMVQADYDNDGDLDVLVLRGAWIGEAGRVPNSLLQNDGHGRFTDVTFAAGLGKVHYPTLSANWADYDNDGHLDLYVGNETRDERKPAPCQLFHNNGDGTFTDVAKEAGVANIGYVKGVAWGDYDADGFDDIYVSNLGNHNRLYHNNQDGTFTDVAQQFGMRRPIASFPTWFWDFDNDGVLDIYVAGYDWYYANLTAIAKSTLGLPIANERSCLYRGRRNGGFSEVATEQNLQQLTLPMGANFGDLDNDGYLDFYLGTGYPDYEALMTSVMYWNRGGNGFSDVTYAGGFGNLQKGHGVAFADLDNDGDQDIYEQMGGFYRGDQAFNTLYENPGFGNQWIAVDLVGVRSNRSAIGARIHVQVVEDGKSRSIFRHVNSGGSFGANPLRQTIGLSKASRIERLDITWPATGLQQTFRDVPMNQFIEITEGRDVLRKMPLKTFKMGASSTGGF